MSPAAGPTRAVRRRQCLSPERDGTEATGLALAVEILGSATSPSGTLRHPGQTSRVPFALRSSWADTLPSSDTARTHPRSRMTPAISERVSPRGTAGLIGPSPFEVCDGDHQVTVRLHADRQSRVVVRDVDAHVVHLETDAMDGRQAVGGQPQGPGRGTRGLHRLSREPLGMALLHELAAPQIAGAVAHDDEQPCGQLLHHDALEVAMQLDERVGGEVLRDVTPAHQ